MNEGGARVVVIGGGVIGLACAHYLNAAGFRVTLIDQGKIGSGSSWGNCGLVCPSHVLPLAEPGAVRKTLKTLLVKNSPFSIKPRIDPALWAWFLRFAMRCNSRDMLAAGHAIQPLLELSKELYGKLVADDLLDFEWEERGLLYAYRDRARVDAYDATNQLLAETFHCPARKLTGDELLEMEPALKPGLAGGWFYGEDAHLRPDRLLHAWSNHLRARGVTIREGVSFEKFSRGAKLATAAEVAGESIAADQFVVATGAWTPMLKRELGCDIPIQPGKGYSITMPHPATCPAIPLIFPETRVAVTPFRSGYRLGSTMEFAGYDASLSPARLELLTKGAEPYLKDPYREPIEERWFGWRPMTYDGLPIIGRAPGAENVWIAAGHNMIGVSMAPATGALVADLVAGQTPRIDPAPYRAERFRG